MEFKAYLETTNDYDANDVVIAFHMILERGVKSLKEDREFYAKIGEDMIINAPIIERE